MAAGLGLLGLAPKDFWAMTMSELKAALIGRLGPVGSVGPPSRDDMADLMRRFPDNKR